MKTYNAVIYCRTAVVIDSKNDAVQTQEEQCREYAKAKGYKVVSVFTDHGSGMKSNRKAVQDLLVFCKRNTIEVVITKDPMRFSRNPKHLLAIHSFFKNHDISVRYTDMQNSNAISTLLLPNV